MNLFDLFATLHFDSSSFDRGVRSAQSKMNNLSNVFSSGFSSMGGTLKNIGASISAFGRNVTRVGQAASVVTAGVGAVLGSAFVKAKDYIGTYESAMATFKHSAQVGEQGAQALFDALLNVAQHSAYAREHFFAAGQALVAMGLDANKTTKYVQAITDTVAKMGGSGQQIEEMADLFGKLSLQTNLYTQDINQMVTAGIPAWDILAAHYHTTTDEVKKMAKQGLIPAAESLDIITDAIEETNEASEMFRFSAAGMANELKQGTLTGALDSLNSSFRTFAVSLLDLDPATDSGKENIRTLNKAILTFGETLKVVGEKFGFVGDWIKSGLEKITAFLEKFNKAVEDMPQDKAEKIAKVIGIIAAAGPTLLGAGKAITFVGESFKGVGGLFQFVGKGIGSVIGSIQGHFVSFGNFFSSLLPSFSKIGSGILDIFKPMGNNIGGILSVVSEKFGSFLGGLSGKVGGFLGGVGGKLEGFFGPLAEKIGGFLGPIGEKVGGFLGPLSEKVGGFLGGLSGKIGGFLGPIGEKLGSGIIEIFGKVAGFAPQMMSAFMSLFNIAAIGGAIFAGLGLIQQNFGDKISEISNFLIEKGPEIITNFGNSIINSLPSLIEQGGQLVTTLINTINANLPAILNTGMTILSTLVTGFAQQLPTLIPLAIQTILTLVEGIANNIDQILNAGVELINGIVNGLTNALPLLTEKAPEIINNLVNGIVNAIPKLMDAAGKMIETILQVITANLPAILSGGIKILMSLVQGIAKQLPTLIPAAVEAVLTFVETLIDNIDQFVDAGIELIIGLAEGLIKAIPKIIEKIPTIIEKLISAIVRNLPKLLEAGIKLIAELAIGLVTAIPQLVSKIPEILMALVNGIKDGIWQIFDVGKNLVEGLWNGINDMVGWIGEKISGFGNDVLNGLKSFFGIASPSKLMRDQVGRYLAEGVGEGFSNAIGHVEKSMIKDMKDLSGALQVENMPYSSSTMGKSNANMVNAMSSILMGTTGKEINVYIGGKRIANEIYDPLMDIMKSKEVYVGA